MSGKDLIVNGELHINLLSASSIQHHPMNVKSEFTTSLCESIPLDGEWQVACTNISYQHSIINVEPETIKENNLSAVPVDDCHNNKMTLQPVVYVTDADRWYEYPEHFELKVTESFTYPLSGINIAEQLNQALFQEKFLIQPFSKNTDYSMILQFDNSPHSYEWNMEPYVASWRYSRDILSFVETLICYITEREHKKSTVIFQLIHDDDGDHLQYSDNISLELIHNNAEGYYPLEDCLGLPKGEAIFKVGHPSQHVISILDGYRSPRKVLSNKQVMNWPVAHTVMVTCIYCVDVIGESESIIGTHSVPWEVVLRGEEYFRENMIPPTLQPYIRLTLEDGYYGIRRVQSNVLHLRIEWRGLYNPYLYHIIGLSMNRNKKRRRRRNSTIITSEQEEGDSQVTLTIDEIVLEEDETIPESLLIKRFGAIHATIAIDTSASYEIFPLATDTSLWDDLYVPAKEILAFEGMEESLTLRYLPQSDIEYGITGFFIHFEGPLYEKLISRVDRNVVLGVSKGAFHVRLDYGPRGGHWLVKKYIPNCLSYYDNDVKRISLNMNLAHTIGDLRFLAQYKNTIFVHWGYYNGGEFYVQKQVMASLPAPACYHNAEQLIKDFLECFDTSPLDNDLYLRDVLNLTYSSSTLKFRFAMQRSNKKNKSGEMIEMYMAKPIAELFGLRHDPAVFRIGNANSDYSILMTEPNLMSKLGKYTLSGYAIPPLEYFSPYPCDLKKGVHNIFVYTNIIENHYVGDQMVPVLAVFPLNDGLDEGGVGGYITERPVHAPYFKVRVHTLRDIEIRLLDYAGNRIKYMEGSYPVHLTLHFKRLLGYLPYRG